MPGSLVEEPIDDEEDALCQLTACSISSGQNEMGAPHWPRMAVAASSSQASPGAPAAALRRPTASARMGTIDHRPDQVLICRSNAQALRRARMPELADLPEHLGAGAMAANRHHIP